MGTVQRTRSPQVNFLGTGFVLDDGFHVVTNAHVVPEVLDVVNKESYIIITGKGNEPELRAATIVAVDKDHDLALLKISGTALPAMELGDASRVREGQALMFTGFPIGMILGFYPVTHQRHGFRNYTHHFTGAQFKATQCKNDRAIAKAPLCRISA